MPREQFFLDEQEDTIHNNQIELKTAKDKRANWWYYHKFHVLGVIVPIHPPGECWHIRCPIPALPKDA